MTYTLVFSPRAEGQVIRAAADFEDKLENLGHDFLAAVRETSKVIEGNPYLYQVKFDEFRSTKIKHHQAKKRPRKKRTFNYIMVYKIIESKIVVYAVFPSQSLMADPEQWENSYEKIKMSQEVCAP